MVEMALTNAEWHEFQNMPEQGHSHRAWVNWKIATAYAHGRADERAGWRVLQMKGIAAQEKMTDADDAEMARALAEVLHAAECADTPICDREEMGEYVRWAALALATVKPLVAEQVLNDAADDYLREYGTWGGAGQGAWLRERAVRARKNV